MAYKYMPQWLNLSPEPKGDWEMRTRVSQVLSGGLWISWLSYDVTASHIYECIWVINNVVVAFFQRKLRTWAVKSFWLRNFSCSYHWLSSLMVANNNCGGGHKELSPILRHVGPKCINYNMTYYSICLLNLIGIIALQKTSPKMTFSGILSLYGRYNFSLITSSWPAHPLTMLWSNFLSKFSI